MKDTSKGAVLMGVENSDSGLQTKRISKQEVTRLGGGEPLAPPLRRTVPNPKKKKKRNYMGEKKRINPPEKLKPGGKHRCTDNIAFGER